MNLRESMLAHNREASLSFSSPQAHEAIRSYKLRHPTEILVLKCMDGRLSLTGMSEAPPGIIRPFRNIGGKFDLGWPNFSHEIRQAVSSAHQQGRNVLVIVTYHLSKGDEHRGCAGFHYDTAAAFAAAKQLREQFSRVYAGSKPAVYALVAEIETDEDVFTFLNSGDHRLSMGDVTPRSPADLQGLFRGFYPEMSMAMLRDLAAFAYGNVKHVAGVRVLGREPIEREHREQIIGVGSGFDWVHIPNAMLIVGPYSHDWPDAVVTAAGLVLENLKAGRAATDRGVLLLCSSYSQSPQGSSGWRLEEEMAHYYADVARKVIDKNVPEVGAQLDTLVGVVDGNTWCFYETAK
jgi:hypothetical protein